jgi:glycerol-3-phosphate dehydrogenase
VSGVPGLVSIMGGKITGYRAIAEEAADLVCGRLGVNRRATTADVPLPGAHGARHAGVMPHLYDIYGSRAEAVAQIAMARPDLAQPLSPKYPDVGAQVVFAVRHEYSVTVGDFIRRRSLLGATADQGWDAAPVVATIMGAELGWSAAERQREIEAYAHDIERTHAFRRSSARRVAAVGRDDR